MTLTLEARALWHLELGYPTLEEEAAAELDIGYEEDRDPLDDLCPECGHGPYSCNCHEGEDCGRWRNGSLTSACSKAGSEECDFECPYRNSLRFA